MEITFLGTSCMVPTKERNHAGILFSFGTENILFDCGEGTQRQLKISGFSLMKITRLVISHWHGDHVLGIPGLIQTMSAGEYKGTLKIYGPTGTKKKIETILDAYVFENKLNYEIIDINEGKIINSEKFIVDAYSLEHGIDTYGFKIIEKDRRKINISYVQKIGIPEGPILGKLQEGKDVEYKGKKIKAKDATTVVEGRVVGIITDTVFCTNCMKIAKDADLLISEAAYDSRLEEKAIEYKHMTAKQAGLIASQNNVKKLVLFHFSQRYKTTDILLDDAKEVFENTVAAHDFMKIRL